MVTVHEYAIYKKEVSVYRCCIDCQSDWYNTKQLSNGSSDGLYDDEKSFRNQIELNCLCPKCGGISRDLYLRYFSEGYIKGLLNCCDKYTNSSKIFLIMSSLFISVIFVFLLIGKYINYRPSWTFMAYTLLVGAVIIFLLSIVNLIRLKIFRKDTQVLSTNEIPEKDAKDIITSAIKNNNNNFLIMNAVTSFRKYISKNYSKLK